MIEVRNPDSHLVYVIDKDSKAIERLEKGWITRTEFKPDGTVVVTHRKKTA